MKPTRFELEGQLIVAKMMARRLWNALKARAGLEEEALFASDGLRVVDPVFDAAETIWEAHHVTIVPCRTILDNPHGPGFGSVNGPGQPEMYLGLWPDGSSRNLSRGQVLMMGGQDEGS